MYTRTERAKRHVLPLPQAVYHAVRDVKGGIAGIAATYGVNPTTLAHKTDPARETHNLNIDEFVQILSYTRDPRLMDSLCAAFSDDEHRAQWLEVPIQPNKTCAQLFKYFAELSQKFAELGQALADAVEDEVMTHDESESIDKVGNAVIKAVMELKARAKQMVDEV